MKGDLISAAVAAALLAAPAWADESNHEKQKRDPGAQQSQPAHGGGSGQTTGSGMMGPGMMGGGMMGPGMMGGGMMGRGMMGQGMGAGAMHEELGLADEQQSKVQAIHDEMHQKHWDLMGKMMLERNKIRDALSGQKTDRAAAEAAYKRTSALREQMFAARLDAHERLQAALTPEQRVQLRQRMRGGGWMTMMH